MLTYLHHRATRLELFASDLVAQTLLGPSGVRRASCRLASRGDSVTLVVELLLVEALVEFVKSLLRGESLVESLVVSLRGGGEALVRESLVGRGKSLVSEALVGRGESLVSDG